MVPVSCWDMREPPRVGYGRLRPTQGRAAALHRGSLAVMQQRVGMLQDVQAPHLADDLERVRAALGDGVTVTGPDDVGFFEIVLNAPSFEDALERVWDAVASAGADDVVRFAEHPEIPEHWRHVPARRP